MNQSPFFIYLNIFLNFSLKEDSRPDFDLGLDIDLRSATLYKCMYTYVYNIRTYRVRRKRMAKCDIQIPPVKSETPQYGNRFLVYLEQRVGYER